MEERAPSRVGGPQPRRTGERERRWNRGEHLARGEGQRWEPASAPRIWKRGISVKRVVFRPGRRPAPVARFEPASRAQISLTSARPAWWASAAHAEAHRCHLAPFIINCDIKPGMDQGRLLTARCPVDTRCHIADTYPHVDEIGTQFIQSNHLPTFGRASCRRRRSND